MSDSLIILPPGGTQALYNAVNRLDAEVTALKAERDALLKERDRLLGEVEWAQRNAEIDRISCECAVAENRTLTKVYVAAARMRTFPVPFDDHFELVGAVDECRSVLEPAIDVALKETP